LAIEQFAIVNAVISEPYKTSYDALPLVVSGEATIGTLCVADQVPRQISPKQLRGLQYTSNS
jgi:hypothetical protein